MTTRDNDTDPSTPGAKRPPERHDSALAPVGLEDEPALKSARFRPTTDPGIAPQAELLPVPVEPMGIVVPSVVPSANDSVDILLDGISGEQPERSKPTPQTEGQAAAAYHVEHAVAPGRPSPTEEPKVVIARPILAETVRIDRAVVSQAVALSVETDPKAWTEKTMVLKAEPVGPRVFVAVGAGIAVVIGIFFALERIPTLRPLGLGTASARTSHASPVAAESVAPGPPAVVAAAAALAQEVKAAGSAPPVAPEPPPPPATNPVAADPPPPPSASGTTAGTRKAAPVQKPPTPARTKARPASPPSKPAGADLGEFKGSF